MILKKYIKNLRKIEWLPPPPLSGGGGRAAQYKPAKIPHFNTLCFKGEQ